jgi:hypothetical protein
VNLQRKAAALNYQRGGLFFVAFRPGRVWLVPGFWTAIK